jgi:hypothetical protein
VRAYRTALVTPDHADQDTALVPPLTLIGREDLESLKLGVFEDVLEKLDLLAVERDDPDLARGKTGEEEGLGDLLGAKLTRP